MCWWSAPPKVVLKLIARGERPLDYFRDAEEGLFNTYDFLVCVVSLVLIGWAKGTGAYDDDGGFGETDGAADASGGGSGGAAVSVVVGCRLLRLFKVTRPRHRPSCDGRGACGSRVGLHRTARWSTAKRVKQ